MTRLSLQCRVCVFLVFVGISVTPALPSAAAEASPIGVLGLFTAKNGAAFEAALAPFAIDISGFGCAIRRSGSILAQDGDMDIAEPNRFVVLDCAAPLLSQAETRAVFKSLNAVAEQVALLEGAAENFPAEQSASAIARRDYILKLSRYTNKDPDGRDRDLMGLRAAAAQRADHWRREVFLTVFHAVGMETPDEVAILYYDTPEQGERFRASNPDILNSVGAFNKKHLSGYVYYSGSSDR